jgi:hypothetical protein
MPSKAVLASPSPPPEPTVNPVPAPSSMWGGKFPGRFTGGDVVRDDPAAVPFILSLSPRFSTADVAVVGSYRSANVDVQVDRVRENSITYFVADIYITDLQYFSSPASHGTYEKGSRAFVYQTARENGAIIAINGDYVSNNPGPVLRDGVLIRNEVQLDIMVMYRDGTMKTFTKDEYDKDSIEAMKSDVWQIWTFGPMLLKDGKPMSEFALPKNIGGTNPRTAVGYYEPGHYVFVTVDGRQPGYSDPGLTMAELSQLMADLGCKAAFNLDGGGTAQMAFMGKEVNKPCVRRKARETLCIMDTPSSEAVSTAAGS